MTYSSSEKDDEVRKQWLKAASLARNSLSADIDCPSCGKSKLKIWDVPFDETSTGREIYLKCPACNAEESLIVRD